MNRQALLGNIKKVVVKVGTSSITKEGYEVDTEFMDSVARQVKALRNRGIQVIVVTSGAIGIGMDAMGGHPKPKEIPIRQAAASVGQSILMQKWNDSFGKVGLTIAQILLTYDFYSDRTRFLNLRNTMETLLDHDVIPIVNENDALCIKEIEAYFGDNDTLSSMVASKMESELLIILSDVEGLYDRNPVIYKDKANLIQEVHAITKEVESYASKDMKGKGVGGMRTKIEAAKICCLAGCHMVIANHSIEDVILRVVAGEDIGTIFVAEGDVRKSKMRWILLSHSSGAVEVDEGAKNALLRHMGLLPKGIVSVSGSFEPGDVVNIVQGGEVFAKGIIEYDSRDLGLVKGLHSNDIEKTLGYCRHGNVIRGENLALLKEKS
ncbi:MAG: glutamate 5-kinase [Candidatus Methanomethylophilaceae archaeon]|nr:glutamate 5-kinase [Candidatus Methanomethylophilaceae archaeon]